MALVPVWMLLGWLAGAIVGYACRRLLAAEVPTAAVKPLPWLGPLGIDPPLQAASALAFGVLAWRVPFGLTLGIYSLYAVALLALLLIDWRTRYVYDAMVYPAIAAALFLTPLATGGVLWQGIAGALLGAAVFGGIYLLGRLAYRGAVPMGAGDISLAALMGAMVGYEQVLPGLLLASLLGAAIAIGYAVRYRSLKVTMPYGPSLCLAALALLAIGR